MFYFAIVVQYANHRICLVSCIYLLNAQLSYIYDASLDNFFFNSHPSLFRAIESHIAWYFYIYIYTLLASPFLYSQHTNNHNYKYAIGWCRSTSIALFARGLHAWSNKTIQSSLLYSFKTFFNEKKNNAYIDNHTIKSIPQISIECFCECIFDAII